MYIKIINKDEEIYLDVTNVTSIQPVEQIVAEWASSKDQGKYYFCISERTPRPQAIIMGLYDSLEQAEEKREEVIALIELVKKNIPILTYL